MKPLESDWKIYNELIPFWRDRYLLRRSEELIAILSKESKSPTERFWEAKSRIDEQAKILNHCLGQHSRSKMWMSMLRMHSYGIILDQDLERFSESLKQDVLSSSEVANS